MSFFSSIGGLLGAAAPSLGLSALSGLGGIFDKASGSGTWLGDKMFGSGNVGRDVYEQSGARASFDYTSFYNSPAEQVKRLRAAGLSPSLLYDQGGSFVGGTGQASSSSPQGSSGPSRMLEGLQALQGYAQFRKTLADARLTESQVTAYGGAPPNLSPLLVPIWNMLAGKGDGRGGTINLPAIAKDINTTFENKRRYSGGYDSDKYEYDFEKPFSFFNPPIKRKGKR